MGGNEGKAGWEQTRGTKSHVKKKEGLEKRSEEVEGKDEWRKRERLGRRRNT